jgi:preprotein translocase subunit YajC
VIVPADPVVLAAAKNSGSAVGYLIPLALIAFLFFFISRQNRRRQQQSRNMTETLLPGVEVVTIGGQYGTVRAVSDDTVDLEVAPGVVTRFAKRAIAQVVPPPSFGDPELPESGASDEPDPDRAEPGDDDTKG